MDWQLPDIGKTIANNILPSILSTHTVSIATFCKCVDRLKSFVSINFLIWSKYVGLITLASICNDLYIVVVLVV